MGGTNPGHLYIYVQDLCRYCIHMDSNYNRILEIAKSSGILRPRDLEQHGLPRKLLYRLYEQGLLKRIGRGMYVAPDAEQTEHASLAEVSKRIPGGVVCLLSALRFHGLTTQAPRLVWLALVRKAWRPQIDALPIRLVRFSGKAFTEGIDQHTVDGVPVRVYNPAKTVADCFKYRNKIGLDVALEALRDARKQRKATMDELSHYAGICRMDRVMQPYMESVE